MFFTINNAIDSMTAAQNFFDRFEGRDFFARDFSTKAFSRRRQFPQINLFQDEETVRLTAEMPGVKKENLTLEVKGDQFHIAGKREIDYGKDANERHHERGASEFDRTVRLAFAIDPKKVEAHLEAGVLSVTLHRAESDKPQQIHVS